MFQILFLSLSLDFEGVKNIYILYVLIWGFGGCWRLLTGVGDLDFDLDIVRNIGWIFPEVFISLRLVKGKIGESQLS